MAHLNRALIKASLPRDAHAGTSVAGLPETEVPETELRQDMQDALLQRPPGDGVWVFAYGALLWDDGVDCDADDIGTVQGLVRRYAIWDGRNRGTPDHRALTLGLEREPGTCAGVAFHLAERKLPGALWPIWQQEMSGGYYKAEWVDVAVASGIVRAVTFIADPQHILHAGGLPEDDISGILAAGVGPGGTAPAYLSSTVGALRSRGIPDAYLERLEAAVARRLRR